MDAPPKVLIADDEPECIDFVRDVLGQKYEILAACDGAEALRVAREHMPRLIILDVQMPHRNGFEVFSDLRADAKLSAVPVVMLTGVAEKTGVGFSAADMGDFYGKEPEAYVEKPIEPAILKQTVDRLIRRTQGA